MFKKNTTQWDQATKLHSLANLVGFYGLWNTIITEVQQITWSSSGTKKKKNSKQNKRKLSMFQFQTHYQEPRRKKKRLRSNFKTTITFSTLANHSYPQKSWIKLSPKEQIFPQKSWTAPKIVCESSCHGGWSSA